MVEFAHKVTFASHQNDVPVLLELWVENPSDVPLEDLCLSVSVDPAIFGAREWTIDRLDAGAKLRIADRRLPLAGGMLDKLTDRLRADVRAVLCKGDETLAEATATIKALARNEWGGSRYMPELLTAFVTPNDGFVQKILKDASRILEPTLLILRLFPRSATKSGTSPGKAKWSRPRGGWEIQRRTL